MFILRRIIGEGHEINECIGDCYHFVQKETNEKEFNRMFDIHFGSGTDQPSVYAFICYDNGAVFLPLHRLSSYYIMTDTGKTFANLTFR